MENIVNVIQIANINYRDVNVNQANVNQIIVFAFLINMSVILIYVLHVESK